MQYILPDTGNLVMSGARKLAMGIVTEIILDMNPAALNCHEPLDISVPEGMSRKKPVMIDRDGFPYAAEVTKPD